jgi:hypothetical protein
MNQANQRTKVVGSSGGNRIADANSPFCTVFPSSGQINTCLEGVVTGVIRDVAAIVQDLLAMSKSP